MKTITLGIFLALLLICSSAKDMEKKDPRSIAEAIQAGSWDVYVIYFFWKGEKDNPKVKEGVNKQIVDKDPDHVYYAEVDCSQNDYHPVLDVMNFADPRDNFKGRSITLDELPMVLGIVHGVGYTATGPTSYTLLAERMPELQNYSKRKSVQRAY